MSKPKRHHYIPQMLLKRFADPDGILHVFDKRFPEKGVQKRTPRNLFVKGDLYTQFDDKGIKDVSVETEYLSPLEGKAHLAIEKIVSAARTRIVPDLSEIERRSFVEYFGTQVTRLPERRRRFMEEAKRDVVEKIDRVRASRPLRSYELALHNGGEEIERIWRNSSVSTLPRGFASDPKFERYAKGSICIALIRHPTFKRAFVIGSNPFVRLIDGERIYPDNPGIELWLPLARDVAVALHPGASDAIRKMKDKHIWKINESIFNQSSTIAGSSRELIESLREYAA